MDKPTGTKQKKSAVTKSSVGAIHRVALVLGIAGALFGGVLLLAILLTVVEMFMLPLRGGETGFQEMGLGMVYILAIPFGVILAALVWIPGIMVGRKAMRIESTTGAKLGLRLSVASPLLVLACYLVGFAVLVFV